jgi:hypothetical protein
MVAMSWTNAELDALAVLTPELVGIVDRVCIPFQVGFVVDQRILLPYGLNTMDMDLGHENCSREIFGGPASMAECDV